MIFAITRSALTGSCSEAEALSIYHQVQAEGCYLEFIQAYMYDEDYQVARNAFWALTKATDQELSQLLPILHPLIDLAIHAQNSSVRRLSMNIIVRLEFTIDDLRTDFLDFCLAHAIDVNEYPGIQSLAIKLAYRMCSFYPELMQELIRTLQSMDIEYYKPAVKSVRNRILCGKKV